ncbi:aromatic di-alanine and TPR containing protein [Rhizoctonia solani AG-3 Rhs1AP]|uniref:Aromatic di-alanine and TPR containing protein n=1 Tax=Rhizoctonia solani AG-3 Rhs1AP TaxID=1086054 RepID=X8IXC6_9AGAM|nr:aromatic di-alanine and TPR containing protein [Rhizoctonia solani AG-3 Rhs1AP]
MMLYILPRRIEATLDLLPQFIWLGATRDQRYEDIKTVQTLAVDAALAAILSSNYSLALEWLEHARCIVWNQSLMLRSPLDQLRSSHPSLATRLQNIADRLHTAGSDSRESRAPSSSTTPEQVAQEHRRLAKEYNGLLSEARALPGFEDFLRPLKLHRLVDAAQSGPIVVINCHEDRCDALVILPRQTVVNHIPLANFNGHKAQNACSELRIFVDDTIHMERGTERRPQADAGEEPGFEVVLASLWYDVVKPILDFFGYAESIPLGDLPHITWCPTGAMTFLPLHAAGDYDQPQSRVFNYVISSYTPTLTALLESTPCSLSQDTRVLAIGQAATPGHTPLPGTTLEIARVRNCTEGKAAYTQLMDEAATTTTVLNEMEQHDWVHLVCHAHQNVGNATESGFFLHNGVLDLASINRRSLKGKGLAYLSACQTATGDEELADEAVHLASGMLMAGYTSVIATMWSVHDEDAPGVATAVYSQLMEDGKLGNGEAGRALHHAVAELRDNIGEDQFVRWVPFIHIGS